jgi:hypothetical protein
MANLVVFPVAFSSSFDLYDYYAVNYFSNTQGHIQIHDH